ncbi:hypothetical protein HMN09_00742100 [Mycena chlorophos]|uniref:Uncharacterized protein n=1 Tax=Mycena chlorophos TaxID=658473 RepID=A0A8H6W4W9_MYCCL|nr:hypothetical protein HMN09_00742100 [Mycena chlorophos]
MPVSFKVAAHRAEVVAGSDSGTAGDYTKGKTAREMLVAACTKESKTAGAIRGTSFHEPDSVAPATEANLRRQDSNATGTQKPLPIINAIPKPNGFFHALSEAYNKHHHLVLRPDDVWLAILVQFNFFVNANSEALRANFVAHDKKKKLEVERTELIDFGEFARAMTHEVSKNVVDPALRAWTLPDFSTTTVRDTTVASIMLMATLKSYFEYEFSSILCGIPSVTLEGERADWKEVLRRARKLKEYGVQTIAWYHLLAPVLRRFVRAFDEPRGEENVQFWQRVAHHTVEGSGSAVYSGWATAFTVFDEKGRWIGSQLRSQDSVRTSVAPESMSADIFWATFLLDDPRNQWRSSPCLTLDGTPYHTLNALKIPSCYATVDVVLHDKSTGAKTDTTMLAGVVATEVCSSKATFPHISGVRRGYYGDTLRPLAGWWLFEKLPVKLPATVVQEDQRRRSKSSRRSSSRQPSAPVYIRIEQE